MTINGKEYTLYWGDLHNHNAVGYAKGSLSRSIDIAREHLDFFAFTGHASWHDMPLMPKDQHLHWVKGFRAHSGHWLKTREMIRKANSDALLPEPVMSVRVMSMMMPVPVEVTSGIIVRRLINIFVFWPNVDFTALDLTCFNFLNHAVG